MSGKPDMKFSAVAGETAAMTAAYFAKHKCSECKFAFDWKGYLACGIRRGGVDHPFLFPDKDYRACNKFKERD